MERAVSTSVEPNDLSARWAELRAQKPDTWTRDAAATLGASEAALLATRCGDGVVRLGGPFDELIRALPGLGEVKTITRNEHAVIEKWGRYEQLDVGSHMGQVVGEIDLRIFLRAWHVAFAVEELARHGTRRSVQIFDRAGDAIHKVYLEDESDRGAFDALVARFRVEDQGRAQPVEPRPSRPVEAEDASIDVTRFRAAWEAMLDTHDFFPMIRSFGVTRSQALRLAPLGRVRRVSRASLLDALVQAAGEGTPIMVFVGNHGTIQIHTGPVHRVKVLGPWINVLDPRFNLHVREAGIERAYVVEKPTRDGAVTALELFDAEGELVAQLFGKRKPGTPEDESWRGILRALKTEAS